MRGGLVQAMLRFSPGFLAAFQAFGRGLNSLASLRQAAGRTLLAVASLVLAFQLFQLSLAILFLRFAFCQSISLARCTNRS